MPEMKKGLDKLNASKPTEYDNCGGKMIYKGTGEYECQRCKKIMLDDYGKVRRGDDMAREHYLTFNKQASDCIGCGHCNNRCPFEVN